MNVKEIIALLETFSGMDPDARKEVLNWADEQLDKREDKWIDGLKCHE